MESCDPVMVESRNAVRNGPEVAGVKAEPLRFTFHDVIWPAPVKAEVPQDTTPRLSGSNCGGQLLVRPAPSFR